VRGATRRAPRDGRGVGRGPAKGPPARGRRRSRVGGSTHGARQDEPDRREKYRSPNGGVDEARDRLDSQRCEKAPEYERRDPRKKTDAQHDCRSPSWGRREQTGRRAVDEKERDDADDKKDLRPLM